MRHDADRALILGAAWAAFALCCGAPIVWALAGASASSPMRIAAGLADARQRTLIVNTLLIGAGVTAIAFGVGVPLGTVLARCDPRRVWLARLMFTVPLVLPSYVLALSWIVIFGGHAAWWVYSGPAAAAVLGFSLYPIVMLATEAALRSIPARLEEAAMLTASPGRVFSGISLPLSWGAVSASLLVVFVLAISDFAVPGILRVRVYTTEVFTAFAALYDFRRAVVMAAPLAAMAALIALAALHRARRPSTLRADRGSAGRTWSGTAQRVAGTAALLAAAALVAIPLSAVAVEASGGRSAYADSVSWRAFRNSLLWSAAGASLVVAIGVLLGYWRARAPRRLAHLAEGLWVTLFAVPATVVGVGIIALWNRPGILGDLYRTDAVVVFAYLSRFLPIGALLCGAFILRVTTGVEEVARLSGASWSRTFAGIVLPMARKGLAATWLVMFILMLGDVSLAILVSPPGEANFAVRAYTLIANSPPGDVARLALVHIGVTVLPLIAAALLARGRTA